jgi:hypothetical protein
MYKQNSLPITMRTSKHAGHEQAGKKKKKKKKKRKEKKREGKPVEPLQTRQLVNATPSYIYGIIIWVTA